MKIRLLAALAVATGLTTAAHAAVSYNFVVAPVLGSNGQPLADDGGAIDGRTFSFTIGETETPTQGLPFANPNYRAHTYSYTRFGSTTPIVVPGIPGKNITFGDRINQGGLTLTNNLSTGPDRNFFLFGPVLYNEAAYRAAVALNPTAQPVFNLGTFTASTFPQNSNPNVPIQNYRITISTAGAVPEPASWAMMIGGFGLIGGAMRRRVTRVAFAA